jgi:hypothetical protein
MGDVTMGGLIFARCRPGNIRRQISLAATLWFYGLPVATDLIAASISATPTAPAKKKAGEKIARHEA